MYVQYINLILTQSFAINNHKLIYELTFYYFNLKVNIYGKQLEQQLSLSLRSKYFRFVRLTNI